MKTGKTVESLTKGERESLMHLYSTPAFYLHLELMWQRFVEKLQILMAVDDDRIAVARAETREAYNAWGFALDLIEQHRAELEEAKQLKLVQQAEKYREARGTMPGY